MFKCVRKLLNLKQSEFVIVPQLERFLIAWFLINICYITQDSHFKGNIPNMIFNLSLEEFRFSSEVETRVGI